MAKGNTGNNQAYFLSHPV